MARGSRRVMAPSEAPETGVRLVVAEREPALVKQVGPKRGKGALTCRLINPQLFASLAQQNRTGDDKKRLKRRFSPD